MTIPRSLESNGFLGPKGPTIIRRSLRGREPSTASRVAKSTLRLGAVFSAFLVCVGPLTCQQPKPDNRAASGTPSQAANPGSPITGNASAPQGEADRIDEIAHRVRILEVGASEKTTPWYSGSLVPILTAIIGGLAVFWSARLGKSGQELAAKAAEASANRAAEANAELAKNAAAEAVRLAKDAALFKHAEQMMEFKQKQIQEFYGPLYAALRQSRGLYDKLLDQLVYDEPARYQRTPNATGDDYRLQVLDKAGQWKDFRLVDQLPAIKSNQRAMALADAIIGLGKNMCEIIATRAGYAAENSVELLGLYMAHHAILTAIRNGSETEAFEPGRHKVGAYPRALDQVIGDKYHELSKALDQYGQAYDRALQLLAEKAN
jgi:hypothetical protein